MTPRTPRWFVLFLVGAAAAFAAESAGPTVQVGVAKADITPELPIRLAGYQARLTETTRVETPLFARALAIGSDEQKPVVVITVELIGVAEALSDAVAAALRESHGIERARLAVCAVHTHNGPALTGVLPFMYSKDLPPDEAARIDRYSDGLRTKLIAVARAALADRKPARLAWAEGKTDFAVQRRKIVDGKWTGFGMSVDGPVDHAVPLLRATDERGTVRALLVNYACHCTTLQGGDNFVHSDWAGSAATQIEQANAGAVALVAIGCGADANPNARTLAAVPQHGGKIAGEVARLLRGPMRPLGPVSAATYRRIELPLDHAVTREELQQRLAAPDAKQPVTYAAAKHLAELDAGRPLPRAIPYPVQTWAFGRDLAMVFLGGEVVADYALRLKRELDGARLWVNAYANAVPSYIASRRMLPEGGYEVDGSMDYYGWATRLAPTTEDRIITTVHEMVPAAFRRREKSSP